MVLAAQPQGLFARGESLILPEDEVDMDWFGVVFSVAFLLALLTGKAYFRRVYDRDETPAMYWQIVGCYAALAALGPVLRFFQAG